jgi:hypothetical protein
MMRLLPEAFGNKADNSRLLKFLSIFVQRKLRRGQTGWRLRHGGAELSGPAGLI